MTKYSLLKVALGFLISIAFLQCKNPTTTEAQLTIQKDASISEITSETNKNTDSLEAKKYTDISESTVIDNPTTATLNTPKSKVIDKPKPITAETPKIKVIDKPKPIAIDKTKPTATEDPNPIVDDKPILTSTDIHKETTVTKTVAPISADFALKLVKATIKGTSTLHAWESNITLIEGKGSFQLKDNMLATIKDAEIKITVKGIISEKGSKMDKKTYETFKSDQYPYITYSFSNAVVKINDSRVVSMETTGKLSMAGASKSVAISAHGKALPNGDLQLTVSKLLKMTDYDMEPPVMFLGTIKVGDEITVNFDFVLHKINN